MNPQIEFKHVLGELSVNRNDPCEVLRELISNSYDAGATELYYIPLKDQNGFAFLDNGSGLSFNKEINGITPWKAFFSIGKSTKKQGDSIGYKCQGSKLCFACARILIASKTEDGKSNDWHFKIVENPRSNLDTSFDITPKITKDIEKEVTAFLSSSSADTTSATSYLNNIITTSISTSATLIVIDGLETEDFIKFFSVGNTHGDSYVENYIRFYTKQGDVRHLTASEGFTANQRQQVKANHFGANLTIYSQSTKSLIPFGFPYTETTKAEPVKSPAEVSRLRDGRFFSRGAKKFSVGPNKFSIILAIDGNRRAHDEYSQLARKGQAKSGIKLSDQRGLFISVQGIKICKYPELLSSLDGYEVLSEGESPSHYMIVIDGDFDLVTNRSALSKRAYDTLTDITFHAEVKKFLDAQRTNDPVFSELLSRLRKESSESQLNEQIEFLEKAKTEIKDRERFKITDGTGNSHLFLSPRPGEEYLVGILYSQLASFHPKNVGFEKYWKRVVTFSTQGIDSLGLRDETISAPLAAKNVCSIEYKYEFNNSGPFNHALAVVDFIVAWEVVVEEKEKVKDTFTCYGDIRKVPGNDFEWTIENLENQDGGSYTQSIMVIDLKRLISETFNTKFSQPPK